MTKLCNKRPVTVFPQPNLTLYISKCIAVIVYGLEACPLIKSVLLSMDFIIINCFQVKLSKAYNINHVKYCQQRVAFDMPSDLWQQFDKKLLRVNSMYMCSYCLLVFLLHCCIFMLQIGLPCFGEIKIYSLLHIKTCKLPKNYCIFTCLFSAQIWRQWWRLWTFWPCVVVWCW